MRCVRKVCFICLLSLVCLYSFTANAEVISLSERLEKVDTKLNNIKSEQKVLDVDLKNLREEQNGLEQGLARVKENLNILEGKYKAKLQEKEKEKWITATLFLIAGAGTTYMIYKTIK